ncbi:imidazole glycerol phosphate synthase subunit HisF [Oleiphilus messinensis]|uniref:imidazole glycerol phosphate synthase subunit HisF n=1 Tax=Oleiphilus messinensis TaxID=141451 RepID=UPI000B3B8862|nr:imidazole glycerol phosphate synthase cyclase subunit [Oleiphilus messinensis]
MNKIRVIPRLDVKGRNVVKGVHLEGLRVMGAPEDFAAEYYASGADEIIYMDSVASLYGRNNLHDIVKKAAEKIFIPLTVGGGIRSIEDVQGLLKVGADKVAINTALFKDPELVTRVAERYGSQCMVVSIEAVKAESGRYQCLTDNGRESTGVDVIEWVDKVVELGAGEILLTSVDREGTGTGFDLELVKLIAERVTIPVVACGGAGKANHAIDAIRTGKADAISIASMFHYDAVRKIELRKDISEGNRDFLMKSTSATQHQLRSNIEAMSIRQLKRILKDNHINTRITD